MSNKPTYEELVQRVKGLEQDTVIRKQSEETLRKSEISARFKNVKLLQESEKKFQSLANSIDDILFALDNDLNYTYWNETCSHLFGIPAESIIGKSWFDFEFNKDTDWIADIYKDVMHSRQSQNFESSHVLDNKKYWYEIKAYPSSFGCTVIVKDITERKQTEVELKKHRNQLEDLVKERTVELEKEISERKLAEKVLRENEKYLKIAQKMAKLGHWKLNTQTQKVEGSDELFYMFGLNEDELTLDAFESVVHPDDLEYDMRHINNGIEKGEPWDIEHRLLLKDKAVITIRAIGEPIIGESGNVIEVIGTVQDITESKEAETELRESKENFQNFFNTIDNFLFILDEKGCIREVNQTAIDRLGYGRDEFINQPVLFIHPENRREEAGQIVADMLQGLRESCPVPLITKQGNLIPVDTNITHGTWNGEPAVFGVSKDISVLKDSEEKFSKAFHCNPAIAGFIDMESGRFIEVNQTFYDKLGFSPEEVIGKKVSDLVLLDLRFREDIISQLKEQGRARNEEAVIYSKNGVPIHVLLSTEIIKLQGKQYNFATALDVTGLKEAEEQLKESESKWKAISKNSPAHIMLLNSELKIRFINRTVLDLTPEEVIGKPITDFVPASFHKDAINCCNRVWQTGKSDSYSTQYVTKEGEIKYYDVWIGPIWKNKKIEGLISSSIDVTDYRQVEEALTKAHDELGSKVELRTTELKETNNALTILLRRSQEDKIELEEKILSNMKGLILPFINRLKNSSLDNEQMSFLNTIESNLNNLVSPFSRILSSKYSILTPREIQIASLIREGKSSKEIAELIASNKNAVEFHRTNLRKKLGLRKKKKNLRSYLMSIY